MSDYESQCIAHENAVRETERRGFREGELQAIWRRADCFRRSYDQGEVVAAICDALCREGQTAWNGDGTSCVEQMIRLQWDRAVKAEAEVARLRVALAPFALAADEYEQGDAGYVITDGLQIDGESEIAHPILWGDLRRARASLLVSGAAPQGETE